MTTSTRISQQARTSTSETDGTPAAEHPAGRSHCVLVVSDGSGADASGALARAAFAVADEWTAAFGADVRALEVSEQRDRRPRQTRLGVAGEPGPAVGATVAARRVEVHGWTLGARTRRLASAISAAAEACRADVIVLGMSRRRMARRHLAPSLRDRLTKMTALPVLVAPSTTAAAAPGAAMAGTATTGPAEHAVRYAHV
jgi:methylmalonyl-CoA mutase cobalamin-binding subunit